jgi:hypothetical protein
VLNHRIGSSIENALNRRIGSSINKKMCCCIKLNLIKIYWFGFVCFVLVCLVIFQFSFLPLSMDGLPGFSVFLLSPFNICRYNLPRRERCNRVRTIYTWSTRKGGWLYGCLARCVLAWEQVRQVHRRMLFFLHRCMSLSLIRVIRPVLPEQERFVNSVVTDIINGTFWLAVVLPSSYNKHNKKPLIISFSFLFCIK